MRPELGREYGFTDVDGRRPDWGSKEVDFSVVPEAVRAWILDGLEFQRVWLRTLSARTEDCLAKWSPGLKGA